MSNIIIKYPKSHKTFLKFINSNKAYCNIYNLLNPKIFDTTLRDGLQNVKPEEFGNYTTEKKIELYKKMITEYNPNFIEVGSLVSKKYFPIFLDSLDILSQTNLKTIEKKNFLLVPSLNKLKLAIRNGCNNFSFISSVSEKFQIVNTNKNIHQTKTDILEMMYEVVSNPSVGSNPKVKIYLSCIDTCPLEGKILNDTIISEIAYYNDVCKPDLICLSDTCATLTFDNFVIIIEGIIKCGVNCEKISLHLHVDKTKSNYFAELQKIFNYSLDSGIKNFDVSLLETGGCVMTLGSNNTKANLSYELYYKLLVNYIVFKAAKN